MKYLVHQPDLSWVKSTTTQFLNPKFHYVRNTRRPMYLGSTGQNVKDDEEQVENVLNKILNSRYSFQRKLFWFVSILACFGFCLYQNGVLVYNYLAEPISVEITVLRNDSMYFPAVAFCPHRLYMDFEKTSKNINPSVTNVDNLWNAVPILDKISSESSCVGSYQSNGKANCEDNRSPYPMENTSFNSVYGSCFSLNAKTPMIYKGPDTFIFFRQTIYATAFSANVNSMYGLTPMTADKNLMEKVAFAMLVHSSGIIPRHESAMATLIYKKKITLISLSAREFRYVNKKGNPCTDEKTYNNCINDCIDKKLAPNVTCRLPFINAAENMKSCGTIDEIGKAYQQSAAFYKHLQLFDCSCSRQCHDVIYDITTDVGIDTDSTDVMLTFSTNIYEIVQENIAYPLSNLLSDMAGNLGFYLGICAFSLLELAESSISKLFARHFQKH